MGLHYSIWALALCCNVGHAFHNSFPFFAYSSRPLPHEHALGDFARALEIQELISSDWLQCDGQDLYVVVSQPAASAADFQSTKATPYLRRMMSGISHATARIAVPEVVGTLDMEQIAGAIAQRCGYPRRSLDPTGPIELEEVYPQVITVAMPELYSNPHERLQQLQKHDAVLNAILEGAHPRSYTVLYLGSSNTTSNDGKTATSKHLSHHKHGSHKPQNVVDGQREQPKALGGDEEAWQANEAMHVDLKRGISSRNGRRDGDDDGKTAKSDVALFEKYNFLNKGIFMGGLVTLILLTILYVGLLAVSSIEITPFAFSKEMGPQNQRKQG